jgi:hypothetical protein
MKDHFAEQNHGFIFDGSQSGVVLSYARNMKSGRPLPNPRAFMAIRERDFRAPAPGGLSGV